MSKKHYVKLAAILNKFYHDGGIDDYCNPTWDIAIEMASFFATDNPNFGYARFLLAVKGEPK